MAGRPRVLAPTARLLNVSLQSVGASAGPIPGRRQSSNAGGTGGRGVQRTCCLLTRRLLTLRLIVESTKALEILSPLRWRSPVRDPGRIRAELAIDVSDRSQVPCSGRPLELRSSSSSSGTRVRLSGWDADQCGAHVQK